MQDLRERVSSYEEIYDFKMTKKLPVIIVINGRSFRKTTSLLQKPYAKEFSDVINKVLVKLASDIDGANLIYSFSDEIIIVCQNDRNLETEAWYDNNIQKIASVSASIATFTFNTIAQQNNLKLLGEPIFSAKTFIVPNRMEAINYLIAKQHQASNTAISMAFFYEMLKKESPEKINKIAKTLSIEEKYDLLTKKYEVDIQSYPLSFWRGVACYRVPKTIHTSHGTDIKYKLIIDDDLPFFNKDQSFLVELLKR